MLFGKKEIKELLLRIEGMHCAMCSGRMQKAFLGAKGVQSADVDLDTKTARVSYDASKTNEEALRQVVADTGYQAI